MKVRKIHFSDIDSLSIYFIPSFIGAVASVIISCIIFFTSLVYKNELNFSVGRFLFLGIVFSVLPYTITIFLKKFNTHFVYASSSLLLILMICLGIYIPKILTILLIFLGIVNAIFLYISIKKHILKFNWPFIVVVAAIIFCGLQIYGNNYLSVFPYEQLIAGYSHNDTLFHASIASMIKNYGLVGIGLDGLVPVKYHALSHILMAGLSKITGVSIWQTYSYAQGIVFFPLLLQYFVFAGFSVFNDKKNEEKTKKIVYSSTLVFIAFLPVRIADKLGFWNSYLVSETYTLALFLVFAFIGMIAPFFLRPKDSDGTVTIKNSEIAVLSISSFLFAYSIGSAKLSAIIIVCFLSLFVFLRYKLWTNWRGYVWGLVLFSLCMFFYFKYRTVSSGTAFFFYPFKKYVHGTRYIWPFFQSFPVFLYLFLNFTRIRKGAIEAWVFSLLTTMNVLLIFPALTMDIVGGSAYYFHNLFSWIGYIFLLPSLSKITVRQKYFLGFCLIIALIISVSNFNTAITNYLKQKTFLEVSKTRDVNFLHIISSLRSQQKNFIDDNSAVGINDKDVLILQQNLKQLSVPFVLPAISETVAIRNLPDDYVGNPGAYYVYKKEWTEKPATLEEWKSVAASLGFTNFILIE